MEGKPSRTLGRAPFVLGRKGGAVIELLRTLTSGIRRLLDEETLAHSYRVARLSLRMGLALGLDRDEATRTLYVGSLLHDVGKGVIPQEILEKPGRLLAEERKLVEMHARAGVKILLAMTPSLPPPIVDIVLHHHERLDGSGYPDHLVGEAVSQVVRVVAVADVYDALTTDRPYRKALSRHEALTVLREEAERGRLNCRLIDLLQDSR